MKNERRLAIVGEISPSTVLGFFEVFEQLDATKGPITIRIMSEGGEAPSGFAIYDRIKESKNKIITEGYGNVMSMAVLLFEAGHVRKLSPSTRLMLHNAAVEIEGRMEHKDFRRSSKEIKVLEDMYNRILSHRTGITMKQLEAWCDEETYFGAKECLALNLADEIILPFEEPAPKAEPKSKKKSKS